MSKRVTEFDHFFGMQRAKSLLFLVRELKETTDIKKQDPLLYEGRIVTTPPLFALATELALKALYCQETKSNKVKVTHDLIKLFEQLGENTQISGFFSSAQKRDRSGRNKLIESHP